MSKTIPELEYTRTEIQNNRYGQWSYQIAPHKVDQSKKYPKIWLVFDTEAKITKELEEVEAQTLKFGYAIYNRHYPDGHIATSTISKFENKAQFAALLERVVKQGSKLYVIGHNVGYDWIITDINSELIERGWTMKFFSDTKGATIVDYRREGKRIIFVDSFNWFHMSLETLADNFGLEKIPVDFYEDNDEKLAAHCIRDVEILHKVMLGWFNYMQKNRFGAFKPTIASQALEAFKQRFLKETIDTSHYNHIKELERRAYYGGRTEANFIGQYENPVYGLDINSAFPSVMWLNNFPVRYVGSKAAPDNEYVRQLPYTMGYFGEVEIDSKSNLYPLRVENRLVFPTGRFTTWLAMPELQHALRENHIRRIKRLYLYDLRPIFKDYISEIYQKRVAAASDGNKALSLTYKFFLNALYGKFGERRKVWTPLYKTDNPVNGYTIEVNAQTHKMEKVITFNGVEYYLRDAENKPHSFPLISAFVTSYLRVKMIEAIERVGEWNWLYCDTDSLYVTKLGLERMKGVINDSKLGYWKIEKEGDGMEIRGLKDYTFAGEQRIKGIPTSAEQIDYNKYKMRLFSSMHDSIQRGRMGVVYTYPMVKTLDRQYKKGVVTANGWVKPYELDEFS